MLPSNGLVTRRPLPSAGSLGMVPRPRRYYEALRLPSARLAALRCLRSAIPPLRLVCSRRPGAGPRAPGSWCSGSRAGDVSGGGRGSQVPGDPSCASALFFDPGGIGRARPWRRADAVPANDKSEDSRDDLSRLNRTAWALAVYASQGGLPLRRARLASGCWPSSAGWDSFTHRVPMKGFRVRGSSSFPKLLGAMSLLFSPPRGYRHARLR